MIIIILELIHNITGEQFPVKVILKIWQGWPEVSPDFCCPR